MASTRRSREGRSGSDRERTQAAVPPRDAESPITFLVPGTIVSPTSTPRRGASVGKRGADSRIKIAVQSSRARGGVAEGLQRVTAVPGQDVVILQMEGGPRLTLHPATARDLLRAQSPRRASRGGADVAGGDEVEVPSDCAWQGSGSATLAVSASRGGDATSMFGRAMLATFEIISGEPAVELAAMTAESLRNRIDSRVEEGLYPLSAHGELQPLKGSGLRVDAPIEAAARGPVLVFVHGTFVDTVSTFGKLWTEHLDIVRQLFAEFSGGVFALDHRTLGASPIANALSLALVAPRGARLTLATHSRGGLVAEVLARVCGQRALSTSDQAFFGGSGHEADLRDLHELRRVVAERDLHVEKVVRVACPARGTLLASGRLDAYLSVLRWGLELAGLRVIPELVEFLNLVAQNRRRVDEFAGLAAMVPDSALVRWLNHVDLQADALRIPGRLHVIAGDIEGDSIASWAKTLAADAFFWTDNDLVVQTRSMYGGTPREQGALYALLQGGKRTHFTYFSLRDGVELLREALLRDRPSGFAPIGPLSWGGESSSGTRAGSWSSSEQAGKQAHRPALVVLPGILGSNLARDGKRIWLGLRLLGGLDALKFADNDNSVKPDGAISMVYDDLMATLSERHDVVEFSFDWRRPIEEEARRLGQLLRELMDARRDTRQPVRLLAHSMGGILARTLQLEDPSLWERWMAHQETRILMLGTPNAGSWAPMQVLSGDDRFGNALAAIGSPFDDRSARTIMAGMPGFMQLQAGLLDPQLGLDRAETWRDWAHRDLEHLRVTTWWHRVWSSDEGSQSSEGIYEWGLPSQGVLDRAVALRRRLDDQLARSLPSWAAKVSMVVGRSRFTPDGFTWRDDAGFVYLDAVDGGDGRVPLHSALLPGVRAWSLDCEHGSLPSAKAAFLAFEELLTQGYTGRLQPIEPRSRAQSTAAAHLPSRPGRGRSPAQAAGAEDALLLQPRATPERPRARREDVAVLQVEVVNADLSFTRWPLMVGHYKSLALTGTERVVDERIGGNMGRLLALRAGSYPEACGSHQIFMNTRRDETRPSGWSDPPAAIVVGLGEEGKLSESMLSGSVRQAVLAWLQRVAEQRARGEPHAPVSLAATLLGSGGIQISAGTAARAIVQGVADANSRVNDSGWPRVKRLELMELYLDRASEAWRELRALSDSRVTAMELVGPIRHGNGPLRRPLDSSYRGADYDYVRVMRQARSGQVQIAIDSRRARTELREVSTQALLVDELVSAAASDMNSDIQLGRTLFQLLVPPAMEPYLRGSSNILLEVDPGAAAVPWELLDTTDDDLDTPREPWALRTRLLRKLFVQGLDDTGRRDAIADDDLLVIGEPDLAGRDNYASLPGARREAQAVAERMRETLGPQGAVRVHESIGQSALAVVNKLMERQWRIIHMAGHGEAGADKGLVLSGRAYLGPSEIESLRCVPELVFVNCCHVGRLTTDVATAPHALGTADPVAFAAGLAAQLIRVGVRCVIAAGWAVADEAACAFAETFYAELLRGVAFGDSVAAARRAARRCGGNTWAAYQCYGDPSWRYATDMPSAVSAGQSNDERYAMISSPVALTLALEEVANHGSFRSVSRDGLKQRIGYLEGRFHALWGTIGAVSEAFGVAYEAVGDFDQATTHYRQALLCNDASASLQAGERLGNLLTRQAAAAVLRSSQPRDDDLVDRCRKQCAEGLAQLKSLAALLPTVERNTLIGSAHKRAALIERAAGNPQGEAANVELMIGAYERALALADKTDPTLWDRAAINLVAAQVRSFRTAKGDRPEAALRHRLREVLDAARRDSPDFWTESSSIELALYDCVLGLAGALTLAAISDLYVELNRRAPAVANWRSVADQLEFVFGGEQDHDITELLATVRRFAH